jgi:DedD protein
MRDNDDNGRNFNPRHRILGAIILVSLAVIFLPMVLDERKQTGPAISRISEIPAPNAKILVSELPPVRAKSQEPHNTVRASTPASRSPEQAALTQPNPGKEASEKTVYRPQTADKRAGITPGADTTEKGWFVQVGTFSNSDNAQQLADKLKQDGFAVQTENIKLANGKAVRVRVGPFLEDTAKDAQLHIEKSTGIKGVILAYQ